MKLSDEELILLNSACSNPDNADAQELLSVFGAERAVQIIERMQDAPLGIVVDAVGHLWRALNAEAAYLHTPDFLLIEQTDGSS